MDCSVWGDGLFQLSDGRYQLIHGGEIAGLMTGPGYILVENALAEFVVARRLEVEVAPVRIWRRRTDEEFDTHHRLVVKTSLPLERRRQVDELVAEGERMLLLEGQLLVSVELKERLEQAGFDYLVFEPGLPKFVA